MNEDLVTQIVSISVPLIGVIIGAFIASITAARLERRKWRHERQEKLSILQREALAAALDWIEPMRNAEISASSLVMAGIQGHFDHEKFMKKFPYLLGELSKRDLSADQRAVLPGDYYGRGNRIVHEFDNLKHLGIMYGQEASVKRKPMVGFAECNEKLQQISTQISDLETDLRDAFKNTFK